MTFPHPAFALASLMAMSEIESKRHDMILSETHLAAVPEKETVAALPQRSFPLVTAMTLSFSVDFCVVLMDLIAQPEQFIERQWEDLVDE